MWAGEGGSGEAFADGVAGGFELAGDGVEGLLAEVLEFLMGAAGARRAGGSKRGAAMAIVGGIVGAVLGTALPVPVLGTLAGACAGAFAGSLFGDRLAGRPMEQSVQAGRGAAIGRFWGTTIKMIIGAIVLVLLAVTAFFPD